MWSENGNSRMNRYKMNIQKVLMVRFAPKSVYRVQVDNYKADELA